MTLIINLLVPVASQAINPCFTANQNAARWQTLRKEAMDNLTIKEKELAQCEEANDQLNSTVQTYLDRSAKCACKTEAALEKFIRQASEKWTENDEARETNFNDTHILLQDLLVNEKGQTATLDKFSQSLKELFKKTSDEHSQALTELQTYLIGAITSAQQKNADSLDNTKSGLEETFANANEQQVSALDNLEKYTRNTLGDILKQIGKVPEAIDHGYGGVNDTIARQFAFSNGLANNYSVAINLIGNLTTSLATLRTDLSKEQVDLATCRAQKKNLEENVESLQTNLGTIQSGLEYVEITNGYFNDTVDYFPITDRLVTKPTLWSVAFKENPWTGFFLIFPYVVIFAASFVFTLISAYRAVKACLERRRGQKEPEVVVGLQQDPVVGLAIKKADDDDKPMEVVAGLQQDTVAESTVEKADEDDKPMEVVAGVQQETVAESTVKKAGEDDEPKEVVIGSQQEPAVELTDMTADVDDEPIYATIGKTLPRKTRRRSWPPRESTV